MNNLEAVDALSSIQRTEGRLANHARWSFGRHAMFGLMEGLIIAGVAQPIAVCGAMTAAGLALMAACIMEDRRRHGMFVSGWQPGATRPLMIILMLLVAALLAASLWVRNGETIQPLGFAIGAVAFVVCTAASLRWEKLYRAELGKGGQR